MLKKIFRKIIVALLTVEARAALRKYAPRVVAVTGSVGKTSTKDAIYSVISTFAHVRKSEKSFNSEVGLPLTILGKPNAWNNPLLWLENILGGFVLLFARTRYPEWLVLEVGADRPGDIRSVSKWLPVDVAVITRLPEVPVHVEFFDSPQAVIEEKASLLGALKPGGSVVLYADDARSLALRHRVPHAHIVTFGITEAADVRAQDVQVVFEEGRYSRPVGMCARITMRGESVPIEVLGSIGAHALLPALAAAAVGVALGKNSMDILEALTSYMPPPGRMRLIPGIKNTNLIDDTYNSSPVAVEAALYALKIAGRKRKITVLGDMLELGRYSTVEHRKVGMAVAHAADILVTVGVRARDIAQGALDAGMDESDIFQFEDAERAGKELEAIIKEGDTILIKGSQGMRMERTVKELMAEPQRAGQLLVRQDEEWKRR